MSSWVNRTVLSGSSVAQNGTNSHTCTFTAAGSGNFLVAIVSGSVTFTTPTGWTSYQSAVGNTGLYVFTKTASAAEASFTTTHNGTNFPILGVVYEYYSGTTTQGTGANANGLAATATTPGLSGLSGTYSVFGVRSWSVPTGGFGPASTSWTTPTIEDYDDWAASGAGVDGATLTIAYDDSQTASSFTPNSTLTIGGGNPGTGEGISFALNITVSPGGGTPLPWLHF